MLEIDIRLKRENKFTDRFVTFIFDPKNSGRKKAVSEYAKMFDFRYARNDAGKGCPTAVPINALIHCNISSHPVPVPNSGPFFWRIELQ